MVQNTNSQFISINDLVIQNPNIEEYEYHEFDENEYDEYDSPSPIKDECDNIIFREYERIGDNFMATSNFFKMDNDLNLINTNDCSEELIFSVENNSYYKINIKLDSNLSFENKQFVDVYLFKDMFLESNEHKFSKQELILRLSLNNIELDPKFIKDLYTDIYHKIFIKNNNISYKQTMTKKYLFAITNREIQSPQQLIIENY